MSEETTLTMSVPAAGKKYFGLSRNGLMTPPARFRPSRLAGCCASRLGRWKRCSIAPASGRYERRDLPPMRQAVACDCSAPCSFLFSGPSGGLNTNLGALFRNDEKDRDYAGVINIEGAEYWLSGWVRVSKNGRKYLSLSLKPKQESPPRARKKSPAEDFGDDIPF